MLSVLWLEFTDDLPPKEPVLVPSQRLAWMAKLLLYLVKLLP